MSEKEIKVTDKRMFTADGELREEFEQGKEDRESDRGTRKDAPAGQPEPQPAPVDESPPGPEATPTAAAPGEPNFFDLVSIIAEPISLYLGDSTLPDGESMENLDIARLYIDLLEVLRQKTTGNLDPEEQKFLDELLYRIRMRYVQKRG